MNKFPGLFLIESPKVDFITILDTHGASQWRDSMDLGHSMNKCPGNFIIESKFDRVILSVIFQDICFHRIGTKVYFCVAVGIVAGIYSQKYPWLCMYFV